jgi:hypothetical protein
MASDSFAAIYMAGRLFRIRDGISQALDYPLRWFSVIAAASAPGLSSRGRTLRDEGLRGATSSGACRAVGACGAPSTRRKSDRARLEEEEVRRNPAASHHLRADGAVVKSDAVPDKLIDVK